MKMGRFLTAESVTKKSFILREENMKNVFTTLLLALLITACSSDKVEQVETEQVETEQVEVVNEFTDDQRQEITDYFVSDAEPTVLDATWTADKIFKIGVKDDGSSRDGFAEYACIEINDQFDAKEQGIWVQVIDYNKLMKTKEWVKLGEAHC